MVLRGRSRRLRLAARRSRRPVQHRRPGLDGHAADRFDGAVRLHPAARRPVRHARPDRHHSGGTVQLRGTLGRRPPHPVGGGHRPTGHRLRREPDVVAHLRGRSRHVDGDDPRRGLQRRLLPDPPPDPLPLQSRLPVPALARPRSSPARTGRSATFRSPPIRAPSARRTGGSTSPSRSRTSPTKGSRCRSTRTATRSITVAVATGTDADRTGGVPADTASAAALLRVVADDAPGPVRLRPRAVQLAIRHHRRAARAGLATDARARRAADLRARVRRRRRARRSRSPGEQHHRPSRTRRTTTTP